jgi:hypothetical protein
MDDLENDTPEEIAEGTTDFVQYLEECDSQVFDGTWEMLIRGSVLLYNFREQI